MNGTTNWLRVVIALLYTPPPVELFNGPIMPGCQDESILLVANSGLLFTHLKVHLPAQSLPVVDYLLSFLVDQG
jgi:hypothetical protein